MHGVHTRESKKLNKEQFAHKLNEEGLVNKHVSKENHYLHFLTCGILLLLKKCTTKQMSFGLQSNLYAS
jgi:hypothetical protein